MWILLFSQKNTHNTFVSSFFSSQTFSFSVFSSLFVSCCPVFLFLPFRFTFLSFLHYFFFLLFFSVVSIILCFIVSFLWVISFLSFLQLPRLQRSSLTGFSFSITLLDESTHWPCLSGTPHTSEFSVCDSTACVCGRTQGVCGQWSGGRYSWVFQRDAGHTVAVQVREAAVRRDPGGATGHVHVTGLRSSTPAASLW